jgi:hypothetical protein
VGVRLADQHHAGARQSGDYGRVGVRRVIREQRAARLRRVARHIEQIFGDVRNPVQRSAGQSGIEFDLGGPRLCHRPLRRERHECIEVRLQRLRARQHRFGQGDGRQLASLQASG